MLALVEAEMRVAMALTGATSVDRITRDILVEDARRGGA
jgi:L-lactate dehydrogenase (cytochrome)